MARIISEFDIWFIGWWFSSRNNIYTKGRNIQNIMKGKGWAKQDRTYIRCVRIGFRIIMNIFLRRLSFYLETFRVAMFHKTSVNCVIGPTTMSEKLVGASMMACPFLFVGRVGFDLRRIIQEDCKRMRWFWAIGWMRVKKRSSYYSFMLNKKREENINTWKQLHEHDLGFCCVEVLIETLKKAYNIVLKFERY